MPRLYRDVVRCAAVSGGTWILTIEDDTDANDGTLVEWCLVLTCPRQSLDFIRGDADSNGTFSGLADGLFIFFFGFVAGADAPPCLEAADANGNGSFSPVPDGLYILRYAFVADASAPPEPFPFCGPDPDETDSLGCMMPGPCL